MHRFKIKSLHLLQNSDASAPLKPSVRSSKSSKSIGQTPVVKVESGKMKINMLSAISNRGKLRFIIYKDNMDSDKFIDFMSRLIRDVKKKVFFVVDNLRVHHSKKGQGVA